QSKARGNFSSAHRAVVDDQILNCDQCEKNDETNNVVAANNELAESLNDASGRGGSFGPMQKNAPAAGDIEGNTEQRKKQEQGGKNGELHRLEDVKRGQQNDNAKRDARSEKQIKNYGGNRDEHDENRGNSGYGNEPFDGAFRFVDGSFRGHGDFLTRSCCRLS